MTKQITWTMSTGKQATVTVELQTSREIDADGHKVAVDCCELHVRASVEGMGEVGYGEPVKVKHPVAVAQIGKLGIVAEHYDAIMAAIAEVKATPEWAAKIAKEVEAEKAAREYAESTAKIHRAMGAGWSD